jgi:hypothetical protein
VPDLEPEKNEGFSTPVLLVAYNRPDETDKVIGALRELKPRVLYIVVDGPRPTAVDRARVAAVREIVREKISWKCDLHLELRDVNLGCRAGMTAALNWFFSENAEGIVLEDDLVPDPTFFVFCGELLTRFRGDARIWGIGGDNSFRVEPEGDGSYGFTRYALIWGWASWSDRWAHYDARLESWSRDSVSWLHGGEKRYFSKVLNQILREGRPDSWAFPLSSTVLMGGGLWVFPKKNLVRNIGFSEDATHTKNPSSNRANVLVSPITTMRHPLSISADPRIDKKIFKKVYEASLAKRAFVKARLLARFALKTPIAAFRDR